MPMRTLPFPEGYDPEAQRLLGTWAAQLDDQLAIVRDVVSGLGTEQLEWQPGPGHNTIGMLLAHYAIVEVWWLRAAAAELEEEQGEAIVREALGIEISGDGMPLAADGGHPASLAGWSLEQYLDLLSSGRAETHAVLRSWRDDELEERFRLREHEISRAWTIYHLLEHFACHLGQIRMLRRALGEAGLAPSFRRDY